MRIEVLDLFLPVSPTPIVLGFRVGVLFR